MKRFIKILLWVATLVWMWIIFLFSAQNAQVSSNQSGTVIHTILSVLDSSFESLSLVEQEARIETLQYVVRKLAHMSVYGVLGILCMGALLTHRMRSGLRPLVAFGICVFYAFSDEWHQTFVPGRSGELRDVCFDSLGAFLGILLVFIIWKMIQYQKKPRR